jgi:hypothetical protein
MKEIVSKELLSEVLGIKVLKVEKNANHHIEFYSNSTLPYYYSGNMFHATYKCYAQKINIHELQHKCKEWADALGYDISSSLNECVLMHREGVGVICKFHGVTPTFLACQWILDNKDKL